MSPKPYLHRPKSSDHNITLGYYPEDDVTTACCTNCRVYWSGTYEMVHDLLETHLDAPK